MLARTRRVPTLAAAMALGLATAAGAAAATAPNAAGARLPAAPNLSLAGPRSTVLPNGDRVLVTGSGPAASVVVQAPGGTTVPAVRYAPDAHHTYVIPESVLAHPAQLADPAGYQIPALSTAGAPAATPYYPLSILQINAVGLDGKPADASTFLTNVDDVTKWNMPLPVIGGIERVAVPTGHYIATTIFSAYDQTTGVGTDYVVTQLDLTVTAGGITTMNADERSATSQVTATTPKPSVNDFSELFYSRHRRQGRDQRPGHHRQRSDLRRPDRHGAGRHLQLRRAGLGRLQPGRDQEPVPLRRDVPARRPRGREPDATRSTPRS